MIHLFCRVHFPQNRAKSPLTFNPVTKSHNLITIFSKYPLFVLLFWKTGVSPLSFCPLLVPSCKPFVRSYLTDYLGSTNFQFWHLWPHCLKHSQNWQEITKMTKFKPFDEIFWNLVWRCFLTKENSTQNPMFDFGMFCAYWAKKQPKMTQIVRKIVKSMFYN